MNKKNNKNKSVTISFNVTPELADVLDSILSVSAFHTASLPVYDTRASFVRKLLIDELKEWNLINDVPRTPAEARAASALRVRRAA